VLRSLGPVVFTSIVVLFLLVCAVPLMHWFETEGRSAALADNRALWKRLGIADYRFRLTAECDCGDLGGRTVDVTVRDGQALLVEDKDSGELYTMASGAPTTVDALFERVSAAVDAGAEKVTVSYDEFYGFPRDIRIDPDGRIAGDETVLATRDFDPRPASAPEAEGGAKD